jgi:hypothetical protein
VHSLVAARSLRNKIRVAKIERKFLKKVEGVNREVKSIDI